MTIKGIEGLQKDAVLLDVQHGARFKTFQYCFSVIFVTTKQQSQVYFIKANESTFPRHVWYTLATLIFGWWGFPWGPIYTISSVFMNFRGGNDVTDAAVSYITNPPVIQQPIETVSKEVKKKRLLFIVFGLIAFLILVLVFLKK
jgi:hypothetical protein